MRGRGGHDHGAHLETASRWITPAPTGEAKLALVDADDAVIVDVDKAGFANFGFHGSWARARHLVDPDSLAKMRRVGSPDGAGAQWYETRTGSGTLRVLWDERRRFALEVASESADGRSRMTTRAQVVGGPAAEPWKAAAAMARKSWYDLLD